MNRRDDIFAQGDAEELFDAVYEQLRQLAEVHFRRQRRDHTLQPTALVHEAYLKLVRSGSKWRDRRHFMALASTAMRHILMTHAEAKRAGKRSGNRVNITLNVLVDSDDSEVDLVALDEALSKLAMHDERLARLVELRFFAGFTSDEIAEALSISRRTVHNHWRYARAWMARELGIVTHHEQL